MKLSHSPPRPRIIANSVERRRGSDDEKLQESDRKRNARNIFRVPQNDSN